MLNGSSTTQMRDRSRPASAQIEHGSTLVIALHSEQWKSFSLTSTIARANASASGVGTLSRWWARRVAVFGPIEGRRESSPTRRASGSDIGRDLEQAGEARRHRADLGLHGLLDLASRLVDHGHDQVFEHRRVFGVED